MEFALIAGVCLVVVVVIVFIIRRLYCYGASKARADLLAWHEDLVDDPN
jgi:hypothetical protein